MSDEETLEPCPFCGADFYKWQDKPFKVLFHEPDCFLNDRGVTRICNGDSDKVKAWNNRTKPTAQGENK